jgi:hypothetical protein
MLFGDSLFRDRRSPTQQILLHLARRSFRQLGEERYPLWRFEVGQMWEAP